MPYENDHTGPLTSSDSIGPYPDAIIRLAQGLSCDARREVARRRSGVDHAISLQDQTLRVRPFADEAIIGAGLPILEDL